MEKLFIIVGAIVLVAMGSAFGAWIFMLLWNWLIPDIVGLPELSFLKAWGLCLLMGLIGSMVFKKN